MHHKRPLGRAIAAVSACGLVLSLVLLYVHRQLAVGGTEYTSFCNVNEQVNCDVVLSSPYATLLGIPVAAWSALTYALLIVLSQLRIGGATLATLGLAAWSAGFSIVMGVISIAVLGTLCLMCTGLYLVNAVLLTIGLIHAARVTGTGRAATAAAVCLVLAVGVGYGTARNVTPSKRIYTRDDVATQEPQFYQWYRRQPVLAAATNIPAGPAHIKGPVSAAVTIIEYSDFECTHCARAYRDLHALLAGWPNDVRLVFRHFPLDASCNPTLGRTIHPTACEAAIAAECAGESGKFWEFHDYLFEHQGRLDYLRAGTELGLDADRFRSCMRSDRARDAVVRDITAAAELGVESTPTLFFNGRTVRGALDGRFYEYAFLIEKGRANHR